MEWFSYTATGSTVFINGTNLTSSANPFLAFPELHLETSPTIAPPADLQQMHGWTSTNIPRWDPSLVMNIVAFAWSCVKLPTRGKGESQSQEPQEHALQKMFSLARSLSSEHCPESQNSLILASTFYVEFQRCDQVGCVCTSSRGG